MKNKQGYIEFDNPPKIIGRYSYGGRDEHDGPLGKYFNITPNGKQKKESFEGKECEMFVELLDGALKDASVDEKEIDALISGDLLNQIVSSSFTARVFDMPFLGIYNACATSVESFILGATLVGNKAVDTVACLTGSTYASAERQYRGPLELGSQKQPYAQHTVSGGGCCILGRKGKLKSEETEKKNNILITNATIGKVEDYGTHDTANMSASMAPAACHTLVRHFESSNTTPSDYDKIITGDLGKLGEDLLRILISEKGYTLGKEYIDCGHMIFGLDQKMLQGGSGAGCSMSVLCSYFLPKLERGELKKILFVATGALLSTTICQQGESIPAIAHAVTIESK